MKNYNTTQLHPELCLEKHVFHRDQFAHVFRWSHVLKRAKIGMNILDFGCGSGNLAELLYRNKFKANCYLGLDIRRQTVKANRDKFKDVPWVYFNEVDLCLQDFKLPMTGLNGTKVASWDLICCFEVAEHITKKNVPQFLKNIAKLCSHDTIVLISTPCFDEQTGAANNHIINGEICEMTYQEFKLLLEVEFDIINHYGTFASQKDYKDKLDIYPGLRNIFDRLHEYYDSNILACLMAPLFPAQSRNVLWECQVK